MKKAILSLVLSLFLLTASANSSDGGYHRILYIGNSITHHKPVDRIGWYGDWGMAATTEGKDYVHVLHGLVSSHQGYMPDKLVINMDAPWVIDRLALAAPLILDYRPDLVIVQMGNNALIVDEENYFEPYRAVMDTIMAAHPKKMLLLSEWGERQAANDFIAQTAQEYGADFVYIGDLKTRENQGWDNCTEHDVCVHPGDLGMEKIARRAFAALYNPIYFPLVMQP